MLALICVSLFVAAASSFPAAQVSRTQGPVQQVILPAGGGVPAGAQVVYLQGVTGQAQYAAPAQGAQLAYIVGGAPQTQHYQISSVQPAQQTLSTIQYTPAQQQQQFQVSYKAPEVVATKVFSKSTSAVAVAPAPQPLVKQYQVHENQVPQWAILRQSLDNNFDGNFQYDFETENGIALNAVGGVKQISPTELAQVIQGSYSYTAPDGRIITTAYTADENGFVAQGDHLPVAPEEPELPPLIAKSLAYIRSLPPQPENQQ